MVCWCFPLQIVWISHSPSRSLFLLLYLYITLFISLFCSMKKLIYTKRNYVRYVVSLYVTHFWILSGIKWEIFSFSLSSPFHSLSLSMPLLLNSLSIPLSFTSLSFSFYLSLCPSISLFSLSFSLAYLMDIFILVHNIKYDLQGYMRPLFSRVILKFLDLLIKLQPWLTFLWTTFVLVFKLLPIWSRHTAV